MLEDLNLSREQPETDNWNLMKRYVTKHMPQNLTTLLDELVPRMLIAGGLKDLLSQHENSPLLSGPPRAAVSLAITVGLAFSILKIIIHAHGYARYRSFTSPSFGNVQGVITNSHQSSSTSTHTWAVLPS